MNWKGEAIKGKVAQAATHGINATMKDCIGGVKNGGHPGWQNRTGTAERSVQVQDVAHREGKRLVGRWGSRGVAYMKWLEILRGSALRNAADTFYPGLPEHVRSYYQRLTGGS